MAGSPKKRARREAAALRETLLENQEHAEPDAYPEPPTKRAGRGASPEWMQEITRRRLEMAKTDPSKKGGRPKTRLSRAEAEELAIEQMLPKALLVLKAQLDSPDERVSQAAAVKVLEYVKGKPTQRVEQRTDVAVVRYESAPWTYGVVEEGEFEALPEGDSDLLALPDASSE